MNEQMHEINGKKFIIKNDPTMTHIEEYRVGDQVMVLKKTYSEYKMFPGVIIGFYEFREKPTIHVAYLNVEYSKAAIEFQAFNSDTKDVEFCRYTGDDLPYGKGRVQKLLQEEITKQENALIELRHKRDYFLECFGRYFVAEQANAAHE